MDVFSHGLWGGVAFGRKSKRTFWAAVSFGMLPDLLSFGVFLLVTIVSGVITGEMIHRPSPGAVYSDIPLYVHTLYNVTHSLVVFSIIFFLVWLIRKKPLWVMGAWAIHILLDIFTHSTDFFPTPFLWPISDIHFNGYSWGHAVIFFPNLLLLGVSYSYWWYVRRKRSKLNTNHGDNPVGNR